MGGERFAGISGVWNAYIGDFDLIGPKLRGHEVIVFEYERLVLEAEQVISIISDKLGIEIHKPIQVFESPAKKHGHPRNRQQAIDYIQYMEYLNLYPVNATPVREALCRNFDVSLMHKHVIPLPSGPRR